jgi:hypothetical protein
LHQEEFVGKDQICLYPIEYSQRFAVRSSTEDRAASFAQMTRHHFTFQLHEEINHFPADFRCDPLATGIIGDPLTVIS